MGSGKTRVACKIILDVKQNDKPFHVLIVAKTTFFKIPWIKELEECGIMDEHTKIVCLHGKDREQYLLESGKYSFENHNIILTSYDTLVRDIENNRYEIEYVFDLIIIDEIQLFMNSKKLTKRCKIISKLPASKKLALSGTPIQNNPLELGLIYLFLNKPYVLFDKRKITKNALKTALDDCRFDNTLFYHLEEKKGGFAKYEMILCLPVDPEALLFARTMLLNKKQKLMYLSNPKSVYYGHDNHYDTAPCTKVEAVRKILMLRCHLGKFVIFSQFIDVLCAYETMILEMRMPVLIITGKDKGDKLNEKLEIFKHSMRFNILLTTLQKSSEGLDLSFANHIIILELWWNPQKIFQAMNRIDRKSQKNNIFIYLLCYHDAGRIIAEEDTIYNTIERKNMEANATLEKIVIRAMINSGNCPNVCFSKILKHGKLSYPVVSKIFIKVLIVPLMTIGRKRVENR